MNNDKIHYEPHPVSAERKAELRAQGFRIIDAQFKPVAQHDESRAPALELAPLEFEPAVQNEAPAKRGRKAKAE